jgi:hypothetical protein
LVSALLLLLLLLLLALLVPAARGVRGRAAAPRTRGSGAAASARRAWRPTCRPSWQQRLTRHWRTRQRSCLPLLRALRRRRQRCVVRARCATQRRQATPRATRSSEQQQPRGKPSRWTRL